MNPANGIIGDATGIDLPEATPDPQMLNEEKKMARYSKTAEFARIQEHFQERIDFYQQYLPDGRPIGAVPKKDLEAMWITANILIGEFKAVINMYETAAEVVSEKVLSS